MNKCLPFLFVVLGLASAAFGYEVTLTGRPQVSHVLTFSLAYLGGDTELRQRVQVRDDQGRPVAGLSVKLLARSRSGALLRLRSYGVTDADGSAIVVGSFDVDTDTHALLQACLVEPMDVCSAPQEVNFTRHTDLEMSFSTEKNTEIGTQGYLLNGKPQSTPFGLTETTYAVEARSVFSLLDHRTRSGRETAVSASVGYAYGVNAVDSLLSPKQSTENLLPEGFTAGATAIVESRVLLDGEVCFPTKSAGGYREAGAMFVQPINKRWNGLAGYSLNVPEASAGVLGSSQGPRGGLQFTKSGAHSLSFIAGWVMMRPSSFPDPSQPGSTINLAAMSAPEATFAYDFHHGGPFFIHFGVTAGNFGTPAPPYFSLGLTVTARNFLRRLP